MGKVDTFDREAFNPAQPASRVRLERDRATTHGHALSQEELVQFVSWSVLPMPAASGQAEPHHDRGGYRRDTVLGGRGGPGLRG